MNARVPASAPAEAAEHSPFFVPFAGPDSARPYRDVAVDGLRRNPTVTRPMAIENAFSPEDCDLAASFAEGCRPQTGGLSFQREGYRSVKAHWILPEGDPAQRLYQRAGAFAARIAADYQFDTVGFLEPLMLVRYEPGDHFDWHLDTGTGLTSTRKLSVTLQLSHPGDYEGGAFELFPQGEVEARNRGTAIVFPSFYAHRVASVTRGTRLALVIWLHGPSFR